MLPEAELAPGGLLALDEACLASPASGGAMLRGGGEEGGA
jgi:hypothetical protein